MVMLNGRKTIHEALVKKATDFAGRQQMQLSTEWETKYLEGNRGNANYFAASDDPV